MAPCEPVEVRRERPARQRAAVEGEGGRPDLDHVSVDSPDSTASGVARISGQGGATISAASTALTSPVIAYAPAATARVRGVKATTAG